MSKYDACTALNVRQNIITSFTKPDGNLRLVFATVAFSMRLDSPNIRHIIHWNVPSDLEIYVQESGRDERDGQDAVAVLYYSGRDKNTNEDMKLLSKYLYMLLFAVDVCLWYFIRDKATICAPQML